MASRILFLFQKGTTAGRIKICRHGFVGSDLSRLPLFLLRHASLQSVAFLVRVAPRYLRRDIRGQLSGAGELRRFFKLLLVFPLRQRQVNFPRPGRRPREGGEEKTGGAKQVGVTKAHLSLIPLLSRASAICPLSQVSEIPLGSRRDHFMDLWDRTGFEPSRPHGRKTGVGYLIEKTSQ